MKIHIGGSTAGRFGGFMTNTLYLFDKFIQGEFDNAGFHSNFEDLYITMAYPPTFVLKSVYGIENNFKTWYNAFKFPYSRLNRRFKTINITLKAPELSESFEVIYKGDKIIQLDIEEQYKGFSRVEAAHILIDKLLSIAEIIEKKLRKDDIFDLEHYKTILLQIKTRISDDLIEQIASSA